MTDNEDSSTINVLAYAIKHGFIAIGQPAFVDGSWGADIAANTYVEIALSRYSGEWSVTVCLLDGNSNILNPLYAGISGPNLNDPCFFDKCLTMIVQQEMPFVSERYESTLKD